MSQRVAVFGRGGQVGMELVRGLEARGYEVHGFARPDVDITDAAAVERALAGLDPAVVFNAVAYNMVEVAEREPQTALLVNGLAVRGLAMVCRQMDARLVHFSTDYVFDGGSNRPYTEEDRPHPLSAYGVSKLAGELYAQAYLDQALVVRTCGVFGCGGLQTPRGNFVELMLRLGQNPQQPIRLVVDHVGSPTYAPLLVARTIDLVERKQAGIFHVGGGAAISWFDFARLIFRLAGLDPPIQPTTDREYRTAARRPRYTALSNARMESLGLPAMPSLEEALKSYFEERRRVLSEPRA